MARKRKSGTGTIRQRKDGRWEGRAVVGYDDKGLPKTKHECQEKLTKLMETAGSAKSEKICADMPFGEWMDFWYQTYIKSGLRPATQSTYESTIYQHMARKKKVNDYGTGIPYHEVEALARVLLPEIQAFFESEEGQREFAEWKAKRNRNRTR